MSKSTILITALLFCFYYVYPQTNNEGIDSTSAFISYTFNSESDSGVYTKDIYGYDSNDNWISFDRYYWDSFAEDWLHYQKIIRTYDGFGNILSYTGLLYDSDLDDLIRYDSTYYIYNEDGTTIELGNYFWDIEIDGWHGTEKWEFIYNSSGLKDYVANYTWDIINKDWKGLTKTEYIYDQSEKDSVNIFFDWNSSELDWQYREKRSFFYQGGKRNCDSSFHWNLAEEIWDKNYVRFYSYNSEDLKNIDSTYIWNSSEWMKSRKSSYKYDEAGNLIEEIKYTYDSNETTWIPLSKLEYVIDDFGNQTLYALYSWNNSLDDWIATSKEVKDYDNHGNLVLEALYIVNYTDLTLAGINKTETSYDNNGNVISITNFTWDSDIKAWRNDVRINFILRESGIRESSIEYSWSPSIDEWVKSYSSCYHYNTSNEPYMFTDSMAICNGDSVLWQNDYYLSDGDYRKDYKSLLYNDSIHLMNLEVYQNPDPFLISGPDSVDRDMTEIYFVPENDLLTYNWNVDFGEIISYPTEHSIEIRWLDIGEGVISSQAIDSNQCTSDTITKTVIIGIDNNDIYHSGFTFQIYPNPASEVIHIIKPFDNTIELYNIKGRKIRSTNSSTIRVLDLEEGTYFILILDADGILCHTEKVIIQ